MQARERGAVDGLMGSAILPGQRRRGRTVPINERREPYDRAQLQERILAALAAGPLKKGQIRGVCHASDEKVLYELKALRRTGAVKRAGSHRGGAWALASWRSQSIPKTTPDQRVPLSPTSIVLGRRAAPTTSWWAEARTREAFNAAADERAAEMRKAFGPVPAKSDIP